MNKRIPAIISAVSNSFCDFILDIAVNKYSLYLILLGTSIGSFIIQLAYGLATNINYTNESLIYILIYGISMLLGYILFVLSLKRIPIALVALLESGSLFLYLIIDSLTGHLKINIWFCFLFIMFLLSILLFSYDTYKFRDISNKKIKMSGIILLLLSMFFYLLEPYLIKIASNHGASEVVINMGYYIFAIPFFLIMYLKTKNKVIYNNDDYNDILKYILLISIFEAIYYLFGTIGYINEIAVVNAIIQELRVFLLFILSLIFKTDKITYKKLIAIIMGILSVIGIYLY